MKADALIVGQGLAGSLLAWELLSRGLRILVVDRDEDSTSSKVAAGLVTPLAGPRLKLTEGLEERLTHAKQFYWDLEEATESRLFHHVKIARLFSSKKERESWDERLAAERELYQPWFDELAIDGDLFHAPFGGIEIKGGGWLDVPRFLEVTRQRLIERASYAIAKVSSDDVEAHDHFVQWKNVQTERVIFCEGWRANQNRFFDWITMHPVIGSILDLKIPEIAAEKRIVNKGGWLLPVGGEIFRAGSSYRREFDRENPIDDGEEEILEKVSTIIPAKVELMSKKSAVRPAIRRSQIFMGRHPQHKRVCFFNGMGSKGVSNGPWYARRFVEHLLDETPLPPEADLLSNLL